VPPWVYQPGLSREKLALNPQPKLGGSRAMVSPYAANEFVTFGVSDAKNNFLAKRLGYCANCNVLDAVPKVDGFFSLMPREGDAVQSLFYTSTNASYPGLENLMGVSAYTAPDAIFHWQARTNYLPLVTAGQKPVFIDDTSMTSPLTKPDFDGSKMVYLPQESKSSVTVSDQTDATILDSKFGNDTVDIEAESAAPALVVVAQTYYHNWQATIDGRPVKLLRANVAFQAVEMPAGKHLIHLAYQDRAFQIGAAISGCMWLNCLVGYVAMKRRLLPPTSPDPEEEDNYI
jgi:hypothetical protein